MTPLIWQWGRRGAGPQVAVALQRELAAVGQATALSLSEGAELLGLPGAPANALPVRTYTGRVSFALRALSVPVLVPRLAGAVRGLGVDVAVCAMPAPLDFAMAAALRRAGVPYAVVVHDAELHPGDVFPMQMTLQRSLWRGARMLFALSEHVAAQLAAQGFGGAGGPALRRASLPPLPFGPAPPQAGAHGGRVRLLSFGRLLPYKGLDLLADALERLREPGRFEVRVVGLGPEGAELARLRALPGVVVENRWVPEGEVGALLAWADALVLTHREASQSGVAAAAISARRWVVSTRVGGLAEQLAGQAMAVLCAPEAASVAAAIDGLDGRAVPQAGAEDWRESARVIAAGLRELVG